ncbi:MAG: Secretion system C-terminal sorting domain [Bacteroidota bacterium]|jgi:hypothetical protein
MKKFIVISFLTAQTLFSIAQSATIVNPMTNVEATASTLTSAGEMVAEWPVANLTNNAISIKCVREELSLVPGTQNYFCWGVCYGETTTVSVLAQNILPGDTNDTFYAHYKPLGNVGQSDINYCFFNTADPSDRACHTVHYCFECLVEIPEIQNATQDISFQGENPLHGIGLYNYALPNESGNFILTDMHGKKVKQVTLNGRNGQIILSASELSSGLYFINISSNASTFTTKIIVE